MPKVKDIITKVKAAIQFKTVASDGPSDGAFITFKSKRNASNTVCFNCDSHTHYFKDCNQAKADCDVCGPSAGHLAKHCLVKSDRPFPASLPKATLEKLCQGTWGLRRRRTDQRPGCASAAPPSVVLCAVRLCSWVPWLKPEAGVKLLSDRGTSCSSHVATQGVSSS
mmetsp:Transcript_18691/g.28143  ORF Transcript_18691/g.28143 Transcript_18691/m.28143 type:complete len:167 (+) Transcript_18691:265-765(+)